MPKKFQYSDIVVLKCKDGYFKVGIGTLKCKGDDNWEGGITCSRKVFTYLKKPLTIPKLNNCRNQFKHLNVYKEL